jgi:glycerophosphoryl diester phosphodiesterase
MSILLDPDARPIVAHRGNSAFAPEDTLEALLQGVALGADAVEFDVRLSRDGHVVVMHDAMVDRTTDGAGAVASLSLAELKRLDAGHRFTRDGGRTFPWRGRGITVPTLDEVLAALPSVPFILEVKTAGASAETRRVLERHGAESRCIVGSFDADALAPFRNTRFATSASSVEVARLYRRALFPGGPKRLPYQALCIPPSFRGLPLPIRRFAKMGRAAGVPTHVWTVDDPRRAARFWAGGVNAILSNDPGAILTSVGRAPVTLPLSA